AAAPLRAAGPTRGPHNLSSPILGEGVGRVTARGRLTTSRRRLTTSRRAAASSRRPPPRSPGRAALSMRRARNTGGRGPGQRVPGIRGHPRPAVENIGVLADAPTYHYHSPPPSAPGARSEMATSPTGSLIRLIGLRGPPSLRLAGHPSGVDVAGTPAAASIRR